jgi:hypothetical protein
LIVGFGANWLSLLGCLVRAEARSKVNIYISQVYQTIDPHLLREACAARELVSYARHTEEG